MTPLSLIINEHDRFDVVYRLQDGNLTRKATERENQSASSQPDSTGGAVADRTGTSNAAETGATVPGHWGDERE